MLVHFFLVHSLPFQLFDLLPDLLDLFLMCLLVRSCLKLLRNFWDVSFEGDRVLIQVKTKSAFAPVLLVVPGLSGLLAVLVFGNVLGGHLDIFD